MKRHSSLLWILFLSVFSFGQAKPMHPRMVQLDRLVLEEDFSESRPLDKAHFNPRQHTRWSIEDGVLRGQPSTTEFQASQNHHQGLEPRLSIPSCPDEFAIQFSIRFLEGDATSICPFIEFGHHKARIYWSDSGVQLLADGESVQLDHDPSFKLEPGTWYHALAEVKGDEFYIRFDHGPELYGRHPSMNVEKDGFGVAGFRGAKVELDDVRVWSIQDGPNSIWETYSKSIRKMTHKTLKEKKVKS
jgi:hypothetical protein